MKRLLGFVVVMFVLSLVVSCNQPVTTTSSTGGSGKITVNVIESKSQTRPFWVDDDSKPVIKDSDDQGGRKFYCIVVEEEASSKKAAREMAESESKKQFAKLISEKVSREFATATEGMSTDKSMDTYISDVVAAISRNVDTSGIVEKGTYWEHVQYMKDGVATGQEVFRWYTRYGIDYDKYVAAITGVLKDKPPVNEKLKKKADDLLSQLKKDGDNPQQNTESSGGN